MRTGWLQTRAGCAGFFSIASLLALVVTYWQWQPRLTASIGQALDSKDLYHQFTVKNEGFFPAYDLKWVGNINEVERESGLREYNNRITNNARVR